MTEYFRHNKWQLAGTGWVVLIIFLVWEYIIPEFRQMVQMYSGLQEQQEQIASAQNWESQLNLLSKQQEKLDAYFSKFFVSLPEDDQMSTIVDQVFREAELTSVKLTQMRPAEHIRHETYKEIPISLQVQGGYHKISRFVNSIEQSKYLMKVEGVNILSEKEQYSELRARLDVKVIILKRNPKVTGDTDA